jgi:hypothetical protein
MRKKHTISLHYKIKEKTEKKIDPDLLCKKEILMTFWPH